MGDVPAHGRIRHGEETDSIGRNNDVETNIEILVDKSDTSGATDANKFE